VNTADSPSTLYEVFRNYLRKLVEEAEVDFNITLKASIPNVPTNMVCPTHVPGRNRPKKNMEIRVLTPAFYSRLIHYTYTSEAIDRECVFTDERNRTLWMCRPQLLPLLLSERSSIRLEDKETPPVRRSHLDELRWWLLKKLRCPPADPAYSVTPQSSAANVDDIRARPYSELDRYVRGFFGQQYACEYRRTVTKLFLAQRLCFGIPEIVGLVDLVIRVSLCYVAARQLMSWSQSTAGLLSTECLENLVIGRDWSACSDALLTDQWNCSLLVKSALSVYSCHAYESLKGYR
jgi:hypothetical protein